MTHEHLIFRDPKTGRTAHISEIKRCRPSRDLAGNRTVTLILMGGQSPIRFPADWSEKACGLISAAAFAIRHPKPVGHD
ncbi:hypothetical protein [Rhizobium sp. BG4]|uniref:hypothetical protein n=1 Tax=Rhizobium sp. BG4 TaxID=2613770 RepID=UPI00193D059D|nr:hypothetical protein [Rhizobium sp. BG4]QRM45354.1 hypothetical protein F2982_19050 [Rhizobium sp. BG4]